MYSQRVPPAAEPPFIAEDVVQLGVRRLDGQSDRRTFRQFHADNRTRGSFAGSRLAPRGAVGAKGRGSSRARLTWTQPSSDAIVRFHGYELCFGLFDLRLRVPVSVKCFTTRPGEKKKNQRKSRLAGDSPLWRHTSE